MQNQTIIALAVYHKTACFSSNLVSHHKSKMQGLKQIVICFCICFASLISNVSAQKTDHVATQKMIDALDIYLSAPQFRDQYEQVSIKGSQVEIWFLESLEQGIINEKLCLATRWLLLGRLNKSKGVKEIFAQLPSINEVSLILYRLKTSVDPDLSGAYQQQKSAVIVARLTITRNQSYNLNFESLDQQLTSSQCIAQAKLFLDDFWLSDKVQIRRDHLRALTLKKKKKARPKQRK